MSRDSKELIVGLDIGTTKIVALVAEVSPYLRPGMPIFAVRTYEQSLPFYLRRAVIQVDYRDEFAYGQQAEPDRAIATLAEFVARWQAEPQAMAMLDVQTFDELRARYQAAGVQADFTAFIDDTASAFAQADVIVCRAGASTVTEIAAVGAAAVFVPFPAAVDDHQSANARFLLDAGGCWLVRQADLTPAVLAQMLQNMERPALLERALKAKTMEKTQATALIVAACEELAR